MTMLFQPQRLAWLFLLPIFFTITYRIEACEKGPFPIPEIESDTNGNGELIFKVIEVYRVNKPGLSDQLIIGVDSCNLPAKTQRFLSEEFLRLRANKITNDQSYANTVTIRRLEYFSKEVDELYEFLLRDDSGRPILLERLLVDKEGHILYGKDKEPYSFLFGWAKKIGKDNKVLIDIITEVPSRHTEDQTGRIETFSYDAGKLERLESKTVDLNKYWNP